MTGATNTQEIYKPKYLTFECDNLDEIRNHINKYHSIYAHGKYGVGKTHMLHWLAQTYNNRGHHIFFELAAQIHHDLINEINYTKATGEYKISITKRMQLSELLFIDDLGNEKMTDFVHECLQIVIDYRYRNDMPTFITSNYTLNELFDKWRTTIGDVKAGQLVSRIKTFGAVEIKGRNRRK